MNRFVCWILLAAILVQRGLSLPTITEAPDDEDEDLVDDEDDSSEADDDGRVYKNPRNSPSTECPRDEEQATLLGQKCLRKCSSDEDCKSKKKKCLCDGACGMSCIKPDRECPELQQPTLGTVTLSGRHFGGRASYTCPHGSHVVGLQSRLCQADGQWAGAEPACKKNIYCLTPPVIEHARHSALPEQATFDLDSTVQYHCHTGYVTNGFPRAKCLAIDGQASWYGPDIQCEPRSCGQPLDPSNGWHAGECYSFGCRIIYHCGEGYELVGKPERYCQADGSWIPKELPNCVLVTSVICPIPDFPPNGKSVYTTVSYNSVVSYECRYGFTLIGESSRRCGADKKWTGSLPTCKEINCGDPGVLYNGWLENIQAGTGLGASLIFRCQPEMLMIGPSSAICLGDGRWSHPMPECLAPCIVPTISQGQVVPIEPEIDVNATTIMTPVVTSVGKVRHGTSLEVICNEYYEFPSSALGPPTCNNGTWSVIPRCVPARCKHMPKVPKNSMVLAPKTDHGMKARFKCKDGYILTGSNGKPVTNNNDYILTCSFGNWTGDIPQCLEVYCGYPGSISHGKVFLVGNMGLYDYRPYVKKIANNKQIMYDCDKGYVLDDGPQGATCVGGMWRPYERPRCIRGEHPRLRWNRRRRSLEMKFLRSTFLLNEQRHLQRWLSGNDSRDSKHAASRKVLIDSRQPKNVSRPRRETSEIDRAYSKYYQRIKEKYKNYIKNLLGYNNGKSESLSSTDEMRNPTKKVQVQDGRWYNSIKNFDYFSKYQPTHKTRVVSNQLMDGDSVNYADIIKDSFNFPHGESEIYHENKNQYTRKGVSQLRPYDNFRSSNLGLRSERYYLSDNLMDLFNSRNFSELSTQKNLTGLIEHLKSQIIRRKRGILGDQAEERNRPVRESTTETTVEQENGGERRGKGRVSCEELNIKDFANVTVVRPGKGPGQYSAGIMLHIVCHPGFKINLKNPNATAKCVRGIWKPQKPACLAAPCSVPSTEHGKYFEISPDSLTSGSKPNLRLLTPYEEIGNGQFATFQCEDGYGVQGSSQFRCVSGNWSISTFPECLPLPCTLPTIPNIIYEGGYRSGLTIAHGSSVSVHCDNPVNSLPIQMVCNRGSMSPATIHCETGARKSREEYLGEAEFIGGENPLNSLSTVNGNAEAYENGTFSGVTSSANESMRFLNGGRDCGNPNKIEGALVYKNTVVEDDEEGYPTGTEILFNCIASVGGERNTWKIVCEDGNWVGRSYICANGTCLFKNNEPNVVSFYNDLEIREDIVEFPPGATIISRCIDIGKYALIGSSERSCIHSEWSGQKPTCFGLNQENDYAMEKPPTILFRHQNGPIAQSNDGKLIVYPGTTVHMECLWMRRFGNPKWNVSHEYRNYPEGWVTEDGRDPQLEYRLSIFHAVEDDSGVFTCQTPARHEHSVEVLVKAINCPDIPIRRGLIVSNNDTKMSSRILLSCANGNSLIGASELFCLPSGNWSAPLPVCESVECGDIPLPINESTPRVAVLSREVGGRAAFSCPSGFGLRGPSESICLPSGEWGTPFPKCVEVQCDNPGAPQNGYAQGSAPYRAGDVVQFNCNPEYMMQGQPIIACQDNGRWSGGLPKCVQACSYPGTVISGRMSLVKFYYAIGESITFTCDAGLELKGTKMLRCLRNGKWSHAIPTCANTEHIG